MVPALRAPLVRAVGARALARSRVAAKLAIVPLGAIFSSVFLRTNRWDDAPDRTTLDDLVSDPALGLVIGPAYLLTFALGLTLFGAAVRGRSPGRIGRRVVDALLATYAAGLVLLGAMLLGAGMCVVVVGPSDARGLLVLVPGGLGAWSLRIARSRRGWRCWTWMLVSYAAPLVPAALYALSGPSSSNSLAFAPACLAFVVLCAAAVGPRVGLAPEPPPAR